ncbi:MAG TPA: hypothetical protein DGT23_16825 [Micromonosporaceae bacterium]|nr:hypothetical protein [Micromonosporaceae bacterium]
MKRLAMLALVAVLATPSASAATAAADVGLIRVDQVGYSTSESKTAYLLATAPAPGARFEVVNERGRVVLSGRVGPSNGEWSTAYPAVHPIDLSGLRKPGSYKVRIGRSTSPLFRVGDSADLFSALVKDNVNFFQVQRDGANVIAGSSNRKPSHLTDRRGIVHHQPVFGGDGGDVPIQPLRALEGASPVDVEGGWFDAGDFVKFTHASAYSLSEMLYTQRLLGDRSPSVLKRETAFGLSWLDKMWDPVSRNLYVQVGLGTGSEEFGFLGDHDVWRLPEADDALQTGPGDEMQYIKYRPVFPAGFSGAKVTPNIAGRGSAAFALASQLAFERGDRAAARRWLNEGASLYGNAKTTDVGELVTAFPHAYYPEDSWQDDMEFGATELAIAALRLKDPRGWHWRNDAAKWAQSYLDSEHQDTLNLYDTSALAHADLVPLLRDPAFRQKLIADLKRQLDAGVEAAQGHPFRHAADVTGFDAATRSFGFVATTHLYRRLTGDRGYDSFGTRQRNFAFGANAWGTSLMIGAGTTYPQCPQHQVANLAGEVRGAVVNGPNGAENFEFIGIPDGANACPADGVNKFAAFDRTDARYLDDVRAWPSSEPAIDFTSTAMLALALSSLS